MNNLRYLFLSNEKVTRSLTSFLILTFLFIGLGINMTYSQPPFPINPFRTTWITTDGTITIPTNGTGYNYTVTWTNLTNTGVGDGSASSQTGNYTITGLENNSTYEVAISGDFPHFYMGNSVITERIKLKTIEQWGDIAWTSMEAAFVGCSELTYNATDVPNLSVVTNMSAMFASCNAFDGNQTMNNWNTSNVQIMHRMFDHAFVFNQPIGNWNTESVTDMSSMFSAAYAFNQPIGNWNTANVIFTSSMFDHAFVFNQPLNNWNTSSVIDMRWMFSGARAFNQSLDNWNTSNVTSMFSTFEMALAFNQSLASWDITGVTQVDFLDGMGAMLNQTALSTANYDATLTSWAAQNVNTEIKLGAAGLNYCNAETARNTLTSAPNNWIITGDNLLCTPQINLQGNSTDIANGTTTTNVANNTDFGSADACSPILITKSFTITNNGSANLDLTGSPLITISGSSDFAVGNFTVTSIAPFSSETFTVTYTPNQIGTQNAIISIESSDVTNSIYTFMVRGELIQPTQQTAFIGSNVNLDDHFGQDVAIFGEYAIIGKPVPYGIVTPSAQAGEAYIYQKVNGSWIQNAVFTTLNPTTWNNFGTKVDITDNFAVVSSPSESAIYIYQRSGTVWTFLNRFMAADFGFSGDFKTAAISSNMLLIGGNTSTNVGVSYVLEYDGILWNNNATLMGDNTTTSNSFGIHLDIDGDYLAITDMFETPTGAVYFFKRNGTNWIRESKVISSDAPNVSGFGKDISISNDRAVVGVSAASISNSVYVIKRDDATSTWQEEQKLTSPDGGGHYGFAVTMSNNRILVGANHQPTSVGNFGIVYDYSFNGSTWQLDNRLEAENTNPLSPIHFGYSVALDTDYIVGATSNGTNGIASGAVYMKEAITGSSISITSNNTEIQNGSTTVQTANNTDFGIISINSLITKSFTIKNNGCGVLGLTGTPIISISGSADFAVSNFTVTSIAPLSSATFTVTYTANTVGIQTATISIENSDVTNSPYTFVVQGTGVEQAFRTTWITTDGTITIPTNGTGYNYTVTWTNLTNAGVGDGSATAQTGNYTITGLENNSTYEIAISGDFPHFYMNNNFPNIDKLKTIEEWGTQVWASMNSAFYGCSSLNYNATDVPNLSAVTDMSFMFANCNVFNGNIGNWNTQTVMLMNNIFESAGNFNQPIGNWNTENVTDMSSMFRNAVRFNQPIGNWNTENVTNMSQMFQYTPAFNQPIGNWNTQNVTNMSYMFEFLPFYPSNFNQDIGNWNTENVTDMSGMFFENYAFNQDIGNWNTQNVTNMSYMFFHAYAFNQDIGNWNIENVTNMSWMFLNGNLTIANYDATLIGWATQNVNLGVDLGAYDLTYCAGADARDILINTYNWTISGDTQGGTCPEINVQGNGVDITSGTTSTSTTADTDFGSVTECGTNEITKIFTVQNSGAGLLSITDITVTGTNAADFVVSSIPTTVATSGSETFIVTFNPSATGTRAATIEISNDDADENPYIFAIQGTGTVDNINPVIPILTDETAQCEIVSLTPPTTTDNCAGTLTGTTGQVFPIITQGTTVVTWTFDDGNGNIATVNQNVIIIDTEAPTIIAPTNITANTDIGVCTASNLTLGTATGTDNCGIPTFTNDAPTVFPVGLTNVTWTADDGNGNTVTAIQTVTITAPVEINVTGNSVSITDGSTAPSTNNNTDFGDVTTDRTVTYTIENTGTQPLLISSITSDNTDFVVSTIPTTVLAGSTSTFDVTFSSASLGLSSANITVNNNDCDEASYDFAIQATKVSTTPPPPSGGGTGTGGSTGGGSVDPNPDLAFTGTPNTYNVNRVDLSWTTYNTISTFCLYRNGVLIRTFSNSIINYSDANLAANTLYRYELVAIINGVGSEPSVFEFWTAPNPPSVALVTDVCGEGIASVTLSSAENGTGSTYRVYSEENGGSPVAASNNTTFNLPSVNTQTDFYISAIGAESGKEGERRKITVRVQPTFDAVILRGSMQYSCTNSLVLQAEYIANANSYTWFLDGNEVGRGQTFTATSEGSYEVHINKIVCESISEPVQVLLNQVITAQIEENTTTQNSITFCENGTLNAVSAGQDATYKWSLNGNLVGEEQNVAVSQSGIYTLLVAKGDCQVSTSINVAVATRPQIPVLTANQDSVCADAEVTFSVQNRENGVIYKWLRNGNEINETGSSITADAAGIYTVEAISDIENSCTTVSETFQINTFEIIPTDLRLNEEQRSLYLETQIGQNQITNIEWYFEGELATNLGSETQISPAQEGNYYAIVTNQNGCSYQTDIVYFPLNLVTGEEETKTASFKIYPNPNNGIFKVQFETVLLENTEVTIFDGIGRKIHTQVFEKGNQEFVIDVKNSHNLSKGMYLIHFNHNNKVYSRQVIIE
ncbi:BspA family leucine-rich repeat surface protein [Bernardetia sp. OM2101]|uniref:BspA family leucine-rich repeat surface protein n=1 Tax=Bernardetia sp. OM2101 TaxID=3344876 RepID=UPI0035D0130E